METQTDDGGPPPEAMSPPEEAESGRKRKRAMLATFPFLALGVGNVALILGWGLEPLWAFVLLPPVLFVCALTYIVFSTDFLEDRT